VTGNIQGLGQASLSWPNLPFWQGIQDAPGNMRQLALRLAVKSNGLLSQMNTGDVVPEVVANYAKPGYGFITPPPGTSDWGTELGESKLRTLEKFVGTLDRLRILEIGGGNLFLAKSLGRKHVIGRYVAVDPALRVWPEDAGAEAIQAYFPCPELANERFDLVLAHNCLEHVPNTSEFLAAIRTVLAPDGRAFLTFPDVARQFTDGDLNAILHEHLVYLDESSARILFARSGFAVTCWESESDLASCLLARVDPEQGFSSEAAGAAAALLAKGVEGFCVNLPRSIETLCKALDSGRSVAIYGATNGLNSVLGVTGIGRDVVIMDGDRAKHGRFLPAGRLPIQWVGSAEPARFDRIFVAAGSFEPAITRTLTEAYGVSRDRIVSLFRKN
jgi:SAM-dependent methyltransferase